MALAQELSETEVDRSVAFCLHCNAALSARSRSNFCCAGCETVHSFLRERGLSASYRPPENLIDDEFSYLDDPEFKKAYASEDSLQMHFYLEGVHCAACVWITEKLPDFVSDVQSLTLSLATGVADVRIRSGGSFAKAATEIARLGYRAHPVKFGRSEELQRKEDRRSLIQLAIAGMISGNIMLLAVALYAGADGPLALAFRWCSFVLYLPVLFYSAIPFYRGAWASLRKGRVSIDLPIVFGLAVGTLVSFANLTLGSEHIYFDSLSALVFLLLSTRYLLKKVNQRALNASELIHFLAPSKARKFDTSTRTWIDTKSEALREGELVQVLPGECFPVDGVVVDGSSAVNCSLITGESAWIEMFPGSKVHAGTWNQQAPLIVRVLASGASSRLGKVLSAMEQEAAGRAPIVTYLDRVGQAFVVAVFVLSFVGFFLGLPYGWNEAINRALAVAIVVCPCTFALATPLAMSLAIGRCARNGVLVKGAEVLERLSQVKNVFLDKTGTLTYGQMSIVQWEETKAGAARALSALELRSAHPIAKAVKKYFSSISEDLPQVDGFREKSGVGLGGWIDGDFYEVRSASDETDGTRIGVFQNGLLSGIATLADSIRSDSKTAVDSLRQLKMNVHILSGDGPGPALAVARALEMNPAVVFSSVTPERKAEIVKSYPLSLMVGDGANDAVALASAHASIAVQGGMEVSLKAAGAYSSRPGLVPVVSLLVVAKETLAVIRRNLVFAVIYNVIGVAVALTGKLDPLFAAILMPASALTVFLSTIAGTSKLRRAFSK